jgi:hypothetical protein
VGRVTAAPPVFTVSRTAVAAEPRGDRGAVAPVFRVTRTLGPRLRRASRAVPAPEFLTAASRPRSAIRIIYGPSAKVRARLARVGCGPRGRPSTFEWTWAARFLEALRTGIFRATAARLTHRSPDTVAWWIRAGSLSADPDLQEFVRRVHLTEAAFEVECVQAVTRQMPTDPTLTLRFLRLRHPARFRPRGGGRR